MGLIQHDSHGKGQNAGYRRQTVVWTLWLLFGPSGCPLPQRPETEGWKNHKGAARKEISSASTMSTQILTPCEKTPHYSSPSSQGSRLFHCNFTTGPFLRMSIYRHTYLTGTKSNIKAPSHDRVPWRSLMGTKMSPRHLLPGFSDPAQPHRNHLQTQLLPHPQN